MAVVHLLENKRKNYLYLIDINDVDEASKARTAEKGGRRRFTVLSDHEAISYPLEEVSSVAVDQWTLP